MSDPSGKLVVKPCTQAELDFYESVRAAHPSILPFIPAYFGKLELGGDTARAPGALILPGDTAPQQPAQDQTASVPVVDHAWKSSGGGKIQTELAIVLENIAAGFTRPNILDVKLGARLWDDNSPQEKRDKLDKVAEESTSKPLGWRIAGMKAYRGTTGHEEQGLNANGYKVFDKHYGRGLRVDNVHEGFMEYFGLERGVKPTGSIKKVINRFIEDLEGLKSALEAEESRMYSASILLVFEGEATTLQQAFTKEAGMVAAYKTAEGQGKPSVESNEAEDDGDAGEEGKPVFPPIQALRLIDFAHAQWTQGQGPDENLLHGVRNVLKTLKGLLA